MDVANGYELKKLMQEKSFWNTEIWDGGKGGVAKIIFIVRLGNIQKVVVTVEYE